ncbi:sensor histidine kinase [Gracilimonas sediminicola]|uniref:histidine kinase n=1 Tax=Gracilimonas sediminicola TaxID=2952158 RepID=A0A9X2L3R9_9BACT|nr:HAMP domain-containing sensor histidine kinase [Gracilimonas sediminicola]MCP9291744.1 HAMP domain-containing histidine kinase [Gracilimonas sediminicola]
MTGGTYQAGMLIVSLGFWDSLCAISMGGMGLDYLLESITLGVFLIAGSLEWLNRDTLLILFAVSLIGLIILSSILYAYRKQRKRQQEINKSLSEGARNLSYLNDDIHRFIGVVSHDLRSPLNSITAISELLAMDADQLPPKEIEEYAGNIHDLTMRINNLVSNMMDANKIELGEVKIKPEPISPEKTVTDVFNALKILGDKKSIKTILRIDDNLPLVVADQEALSRVLENLINNAYKFSHPDSSVTIKVEHLSAEQKVRISIGDEGPGFTEEDRKNMYNKFSKLSASPTGGEKTTGLGLYIVQKLVHRMDGRIELESEPGSGSVFSIYLKSA